MGRFLSKAENDKSKWVDVVPVAIVDNENSAGVAMAVADGADVTQGAIADAAYASANGSATGTVVSLLKGLYVAIVGNLKSVGNVAHDAVDSGAPVKIGGYASLAAPVAVADADRVNLWLTRNGAVASNLVTTNGASIDGGTLGADGRLTTNVTLLTSAFGFVFNGTNWDRQRGDTAGIWTNQSPSVAAGVALTSVKSAALETGKVIKAAAGNLYGLNLVATVGGMFLVHNSATVPAAGAVTPVKAYPVVAGQAIDISFNPPIRFSTGISVSFTTAATPFTQTDSATAFISGDAA